VTVSLLHRGKPRYTRSYHALCASAYRVLGQGFYGWESAWRRALIRVSSLSVNGAVAPLRQFMLEAKDTRRYIRALAWAFGETPRQRESGVVDGNSQRHCAVCFLCVCNQGRGTRRWCTSGATTWR
jgi:hypothetical protein